MRPLNAQFELFRTAGVAGGDGSGGLRHGAKLLGWGTFAGAQKDTKTVGTNSKKSLKTKEELRKTDLKRTQNELKIRRRFAPIGGRKEQKLRILRKTKLRCST